MNSTAAIVVIATFAIFIVGIAVGVLVLVSVAIRREDREFSRSWGAPDHVSRGARRIMGVGVRASGNAVDDLKENPFLSDEWLSANSRIEDTYKKMGPPPSGEDTGQQDE